VIGDPEEVAEKILRHNEALGGISRFTFQMDNPGLSKEDIFRAIELIGTEVILLSTNPNYFLMAGIEFCSGFPGNT
jgi:alkanesulfonate monooxygenase SsuD/methylene tetrahydromethanopterin reductase-like flavin-dependent oxidoreductase (luciferase family)